MNSKYYVEKEGKYYYIYEYDNSSEGSHFVKAVSSKDDLAEFDPELVKIQESLEKEKLKEAMKSNRRIWNPDRHLDEVCNLYRKWAGWDDDEVITEEHFKNQDWRLRKMSALKNTPVNKIKEGLLNQRIQNK